MTKDNRPAKPEHDAPADLAAGDGPTKGDTAPRPGGDRLKAPVGKGRRGVGRRQPREYAEQLAKQPPAPGARSGHARAAEAADGYVRLQMRATDRGALRVLDAHLVDGPLAQTSVFGGDFAYEVRLGDRLLHASTLPDLGVRRSLIAPDGPPEQRQHHISALPAYEFTVRVPASELTPESIGEVEVTLHRVKGVAPARPLTDRPLTEQYAEQLRPLVGMIGLPQSALPQELVAAGKRTGQGAANGTS